MDDDDEDFSLDDAAEEKTPVKETSAAVEATEAPAAPSTDEKEAVDDEIAALQKKLEMLLKQKLQKHKQAISIKDFAIAKSFVYNRHK